MGLAVSRQIDLSRKVLVLATYNRRLAELIHHGRAKPSQIISHRLKLAEAPNAYKHFDARDDGWTKVVLKPAA